MLAPNKSRLFSAWADRPSPRRSCNDKTDLRSQAGPAFQDATNNSNHFSLSLIALSAGPFFSLSFRNYTTLRSAPQPQQTRQLISQLACWAAPTKYNNNWVSRRESFTNLFRKSARRKEIEPNRWMIMTVQQFKFQKSSQ